MQSLTLVNLITDANKDASPNADTYAHTKANTNTNANSDYDAGSIAYVLLCFAKMC